MSDLRNLCRCSHVRSSHEDGPCRSCDCRAWAPAYPEDLPEGVRVVRDLRSQALHGLSLVECLHAETLRVDGRCGFCHADALNTASFFLPVQRLAFAPTELTLL